MLMGLCNPNDLQKFLAFEKIELLIVKHYFIDSTVRLMRMMMTCSPLTVICIFMLTLLNW